MDYKPPPTVRDFITSPKFYNFVVGPVGSGKTVGSIMKIFHHAFRQEKDPQSGLRKTRWVVVRNTLQQLKDTTLSSFFEWFPPGVAGEWRASENKFIFRSGDVYCEILFRPLDSPDDVRRVLSLEVTGAVLDEFVEIPREIVESLSGRCGRYPRSGQATWKGMWGATNPGNEDNWWYDWLYGEWDAAAGNKADMLGYFEQPSGLSPAAENLEYLPGGAGYYTDLAVGKTKAWIRQFIEVQWGFSVSGKPVFPEFKREFHVPKELMLAVRHAPIIIGFDAGLTPSAAICQQAPSGQLRILDEVLSEGMGARRFCRELLGPRLRHYEGMDITLVGDPAFTQRSQADEQTVMQVLQQELQGVGVVPAYTNTLADRLDAVSMLLTRLTDNGPALMVNANCRTIATGFSSGYKYAVDKHGKVAPKPEKNNYSHPMDAVQYACLEATRGLRSVKARNRQLQHVQLNRGSFYA